MKTQALPLAIWILISVTAGAITSLLITGLFKLSNYFAAKQLWQRRRDVGAAQTSSNTRRSDAPSSANRSESSNTNSTPSDASDWDTDSSGDDDWNFDEDAEKTKTLSLKMKLETRQTMSVSNNQEQPTVWLSLLLWLPSLIIPPWVKLSLSTMLIIG
jgi:FtsZ-interacting cell division protein ZipA